MGTKRSALFLLLTIGLDLVSSLYMGRGMAVGFGVGLDEGGSKELSCSLRCVLLFAL